MTKILVVLLTLTVCVAMPLMAQDKEMAKKDDMPAMPTPPAPLDDDFMNWMVGEWEGSSEHEGAMGKSEVWMKCEMGVDGQFMMMEFKSKSAAMGQFTGRGAYTLDETGGIKAFWIDSFRDMGQGKGTREGDVMTMSWESKMGKGTRVTTKVSDDKMTGTGEWEMPNGMIMKDKTEMTRVKKTTDKSY